MQDNSSETPTKFEAAEVAFDNATAIRDNISIDLYKDITLFRQDSSASSSTLPVFEITGLDDTKHDRAETKVAFALRDDSTKTATTPLGKIEAELRSGGMVRNERLDHGYEIVYTPSDGKPDSQSRTKVEITLLDGRLKETNTFYKDGSSVSESYDDRGLLESTETTKPDGTKTTKFEGIVATSDTMKAAYEKGGAADLKREIQNVLNDPNGGWDKLNTMISELKEKAVPVYMYGKDLYLNDSNIPWGDSHLATKPEPPPAPAPEADELSGKADLWDALPWNWSRKINNTIDK